MELNGNEMNIEKKIEGTLKINEILQKINEENM
jgi:hypothetical protein